MVALGRRSRLSSGARMKKMGTEIILGVVIVGPAAIIAVASRWTSEDWLRSFAIVARSLWRPM